MIESLRRYTAGTSTDADRCALRKAGLIEFYYQKPLQYRDADGITQSASMEDDGTGRRTHRQAWEEEYWIPRHRLTEAGEAALIEADSGEPGRANHGQNATG